MRIFRFLVLSLLLVALTQGGASAGAFMMPQGQGQFIAGVGYAEASRRFVNDGTAAPSPTSRKAVASGYLEYGLTNWLSLIAAPTLTRSSGAANTVTGSDSSALGARLQLYGSSDKVFAVQALLQPPVGNSDQASMLADGGARAFAADLRVLYGQAFVLFGWTAFIDIEPGVRLHPEPLPNEARLDLTFGVRPIPRLMFLVQDFSAWAPAHGPLVPRQAYNKLQASLVYDLSARWSVEAGAFTALAGRNAICEAGPFAALWYRF